MSTKQSLLQLLENCKGKSLSGEAIAKMLSVSRSAVWKAIKELQKEGYQIFAATNKGYSLSPENDVISAEGIRTYLNGQNDIFVYNELESTNKTAKEIAINGAKHGTIIIAKRQTLGSGRFGRSFYSPEGGLYMSIILKPDCLHLKNPTAVTALAGLCVCKAIENLTDLHPKIKWVNDIFLNGKKICGILTEATTDCESGSLQWMVLGLGINFFLDSKSMPADLTNIIGALFEGEKQITRNRLAAEIINLILNTNTISKAEIFNEYKKYLFMLGKKVTVKQGDTCYPATALDINDQGHLLIKKESGELASLSFGEISISTS